MKEHDDVGKPVFSPKGDRVAYAAKDGTTWRVLCGETASKPYDHVGRPVFSPDGKHIAFGARDGKRLLWVTMPADPAG